VKRTFVLSGGGAWGAMQAGALRSLLEHDVVPDTLVGCSVGALNAANLAREVSLEQLDHVAGLWRNVSRRIVYPGGRMSILWRVATGQDSLHDNRAFYQFLQDSGCTPALTFGGIGATQLYVTATNLRTGSMHVFGDDPNDRLLDALMASTALTPLHPPWEVNGERYVDGGTVTSLPLRVALERGATDIWALHLRDEKARPGAAGRGPAGRGAASSGAAGRGSAGSGAAGRGAAGRGAASDGDGEDGDVFSVHGVAGHITKAVDTMLRLQVEHDLHLVSGDRRIKFHHVSLAAPYRIDPTDFSHADDLIDAGYEQMNAYLERPAPVVSVSRVRPVGGWWNTFWGRWQAS
jgi:NTE family protein